MRTRAVQRTAWQCIVPPYIAESIELRGSPAQQRLARELTEQAGRQRTARMEASGGLYQAVPVAAVKKGKAKNEVYDAQNQWPPPPGQGPLSAGERATDVAAQEAFDGAQDMCDFLIKEFQRDSVDGNGMTLVSSVHVGNSVNNAFWSGSQMLYGDGDGSLFNRFTISPSVIAHELGHGVIQYSGGLVYQGQSGALNEHLADVFGCMMVQWKLQQDAASADWLVGAGLLGPDVDDGAALRSMRAPGTAYVDDVLGKDPQPFHMDDYVMTSGDNGGVHINSGIPNHVFYLASMLLGGFAWTTAGPIWYEALQHLNNPHATFKDWAYATIDAAGVSPIPDAGLFVRRAWKLAGIDV